MKKSIYKFFDGHIIEVCSNGYLEAGVIKFFEKCHGPLVSVKRNGKTVLAVQKGENEYV